MIIRDMFKDDINRTINGVVKVNQETVGVVEDEVREYVITRELKRHFITFFNYYGDAFSKPTADMGVWISGFFGSGKSHFLKMLSYLLENRSINGVKTVERFREKFADDPATFMLIDNATRGKTETILFNIDIEGSITKDKTAVLRVFAKMFYNHLGFYGENLKVAMLEKYIDNSGKTEEFRRVFEQKKGKPWVEQRKVLAFNGKFVIPTLMEVLGLSEEDARNWFNDKSAVDFSIAQLVEDIKAYIDTQPKDFRLLFMVDEVGQYVGTDTDLLLNLQSLTEEIGNRCEGKVWVVCTGQEALDDVIKVRINEFSRIQARFKTRLSLTSSSVDEVVQKRILSKKPTAAARLEQLYEENDSVLRNLLGFKKEDAMSDIKGFTGATEFATVFPFVPYQFIIMQKVFNEIRRHGNVGTHQSNSERSMLSGFQEAAQRVQEKDEYALVPFYRFYDTLHSFLDGSIRRVIERAQKAAEGGLGLELFDVDVLKLLYLVRYVDDLKKNLDNIVILMADDIRTDKIVLREAVLKSLDRLMRENYIGRVGDTYNFLTDEEQDVQKAIRDTQVDTANIVERIAQLIFGDIYPSKKYRYGKYDFAYDQMVDGVVVGALTGGMKLRFLTVATDAVDKADSKLMMSSYRQAIVVLSNTPYYDSLESAMKISKYVKQKNISQLPKSVQDIIRGQQDQAATYNETAKDALKKAIEGAEFYVDGEHLSIKSGDAKSKIDQALEYLVAHVYNKLDLIGKNAESDQDIIEALTAQAFGAISPNQGAAAEMEEYLEIQHEKLLPTSMSDIQSRYQAIPYGWREIDVAAAMALLIRDQKVTVKYAGTTIQPTNPKLPDMLRKKSEIGKTMVSMRQSPPALAMKQAREILRDYFDVMDVPSDEDGLVAFIANKFAAQKAHYEVLLARYDGKKYPDKALVEAAVALMNEILSQQKDNVALVNAVIKKENALFDNKEAMQNVEAFFKSQVQVYDAADRMLRELSNELDYLSHEKEANDALNRIRLLLVMQKSFNYKCIPELNTLMATVRTCHDRLLTAKREELLELIRQCMEAIHTAAGSNSDAKKVSDTADAFYAQKKQRIQELESLALLDGLTPSIIQQKDTACARIESLNKPVPPKPPVTPVTPPTPPVKKIIKTYNRQILFPPKLLESQADLDAYVAQVREQLEQLMKNCDGIQLK